MITEEEREFIGWFNGEGFLGIRRNNNRGLERYRVTIRVNQRMDDPEMIKWCQKRFGGIIQIKQDSLGISSDGTIRRNNPQLRWEVTGFRQCREVIRVLRAGKFLTAKRLQLDLLMEFMGTEIGGGKRFATGAIENQRRIKRALSEAKKYKGPKWRT